MIRKSTYLISIPHSQDAIFINSLTGAIDEVSNYVVSNIDNGTLDADIIKYLRYRGHLTHLTESEEKEFALKVWNEINKVQKSEAHIIICASTDCNFRCTYCFERPYQNLIDSGLIPHNKTNLTIDQVDIIFESLIHLKDFHTRFGKNITLFGGEPLWAKNYSVVEYLVKKSLSEGFTLSAITNGYELSAFKNLLGKNGISTIQVSIDGPREIHDQMRPTSCGKPTFDQIVSELKKVINIEGLNIGIRMNYDSTNMKYAPILLQQLKDFEIIGENPNVKFHANLISLNHENKTKDYKTLKEYGKISDEVGDYTMDCYTTTLRRHFVEALRTGSPFVRKAHFCAATYGMYVFCPDGKLYSCWEGIGEEHSLIGEFEPTFKWYTNGINNWHNRNATNLPDCQSCNHLFFCGGGCAVHAYERTGNYNVSECDGIKKKFAYMVKTEFEEKNNC